MDADIYDLNDNEKLYAVLKVVRSADDSVIKRAYHKLAMQYHPDKNPAGGDMFKAISFAYTILSDPEQRARYDNKTLKAHIRNESCGGGGGRPAPEPEMDPTVELTSDQLNAFVEKLRNQQRDAEKRRVDFEKQREAEMARRAEWDAKNPHFRMPDLPQATIEQKRRAAEFAQLNAASASVGAYGASAAAMTSADASVLLERRLQEINAGGRRGSDCESGDTTPRGGGASHSGAEDANSAKARMMAQFRQARVGAGVPSTKPVAALDAREELRVERKYGVNVSNGQSHYTYEADTIKNKRGNFDYCGFVAHGYTDGSGVVKEAILADALDTYAA